MTLTPAGRYVAACLALTVLLLAVGVVERVASGAWDAEKVIAVGVGGPLAFLMALMATVSWRWWE